MSDNIEESVSLLTKVAQKFGVKPDDLKTCLSETAFRQKDGRAMTRSQLMQMLIVVDRYNLNPFMKEVYAYPDKQGAVVPVVGIDGWLRMINSHPQFDGMDFKFSPELTTPVDGKECPEWIECSIHRKDRTHPTVIREYIDEVYRPPLKRADGSRSNTPWQSHTKRFFRHKAIIQASRVAFSFVGVYDEDEAQRILEAEGAEAAPAAEQPRNKGGKLVGIDGLKSALGAPVSLPVLDADKVATTAAAVDAVVNKGADDKHESNVPTPPPEAA